MDSFRYQDSPYPIRTDLSASHQRYWQALARPGNWFSGAERIAIAAEVRNATQCAYCAQRKQALSPYNFEGEHRSDDVLSSEQVDAVHRIITDQSRITQAWINQNLALGFSEEQYVELLGVTVTVFSIDEFNRALGLPLEPLPDPLPGEPDHYRPSETEHDTGFVAMIPPDGATGKESDLWPKYRTANVLRALSLVPNAVRQWMDVAGAQYLTPKTMVNMAGGTGRSINRMQIELVAGRVSSINECFY
jgi:hypothetical protein